MASFWCVPTHILIQDCCLSILAPTGEKTIPAGWHGAPWKDGPWRCGTTFSSSRNPRCAEHGEYRQEGLPWSDTLLVSEMWDMWRWWKDSSKFGGKYGNMWDRKMWDVFKVCGKICENGLEDVSQTNIFITYNFTCRHTVHVGNHCNSWKKYVDVSKNRGTPKWMVYNGKPY